MSVSRMRLLAFALAAAGIVAAGLFVTGQARTSEPGSGAPAHVAGHPEPPKQTDKQADKSVRVDAPGTVVDVDKERGKVSVAAPHTDVRVDPTRAGCRCASPTSISTSAGRGLPLPRIADLSSRSISAGRGPG